MALEKIVFTTPLLALNKAYRKQKVYRGDIERFRGNLANLLNELDENESEEHLKNDVIQFLNDTWYKGEYAINTKDRTDLVIHNDKTSKSTVGVLLEVKKPSNKSEMVSKGNLNVKALQELVLYYLRERVDKKNTDIKHLVVTNIYEWFVFDANTFYEVFYKNAALVKEYKQWNAGQKDTSKTELFYKEIASPAIEKLQEQLSYTWFDLQEYEKELKKEVDSKKLLSLYKVLSPVHLLKQPFTNDSNSLNKQFYHELLHIIGLEEKKEKGKKIIQRKEKGKRDTGSLLENAMMILDERDRLRMLDRPSHFGKNTEEQAYNVGLELCITWVNRILFLKLLESQLVNYHKGDKEFRFLNSKTIPDYDVLDRLFFGVLARKHNDRHERYKETFANIPYLNSSLFEPTGLEEVLSISMLSHDTPIDVYSQTVLKNNKGKRISGKKDPLTYLFEFLDAYDFSSEGKEEIQEESKSLINASVLGLIFEKINGYKDGSFYTPGFITMYMCRETIRRAVVQKFNEAKGWELENFEQLYDKIEDKKEANDIINSLKICDPAVGSGHFLVSALNEIITIKSELRILIDKEGKTLRDYDITIENDELIITDDNGEFFEYSLGSNEKQRVQETLFHEKQTIIENCLFGVDINPNSVKICRLRLWIELLKNAYYLHQGDKNELQTLPNIDINIKTGNSLISRFDLDTDISDALKKSKWNITTYRNAVDSYKNATSKEDKREFEKLIDSIKGDFETEINKKDKRLIRLNKRKGELFNLTQQQTMFEMGNKEKKVWEKEVEKKTNAVEKLEKELEEIKSNKIYEDAFEWRFEFPEVLDDEGNFNGFDVVIGNPPYIRQEELGDIKKYLESNFKVFTSGGDIFSYFYELSYKIMRGEAYFTFINNTFDKTTAGKKLREFVEESFRFDRYIDFTDVVVFEEATTYPIIIIIQKSDLNSIFKFFKYSKTNFHNKDLLNDESIFIDVAQDKLNTSAWNFISTFEQSILSKIQSHKTIGDLYGKCYRGIITGLNEAFVTDEELGDFPVIKDVYDGKDLKKWKAPLPFKKMIVFESKSTSKNFGESGENEAYEKMKKAYPEIFKHLIPFKEKAINRYDKGEFWWELRNCAYYDLFENPKIIFPNLQNTSKFAFDDKGVYLNAPAVFLPSNDKSLLAILNSKVVWYFLKSICVIRSGGYIEVKPQYFEQIPIPIIDEAVKFKLNHLAEKAIQLKSENAQADIKELEIEIDQLVYELYGLSEDEVKIIEEKLQ